MSLQQRKEIARWFMLLAGIALMVLQIIKYQNNTLGTPTVELGVLCVSVILMIFPRMIIQFVENRFINTTKKES